MAQAIFNKKAGEKGLDAMAFSAGLCADGSNLSENSKTARWGYGIQDFSHSSVQLTKELVLEYDYIIGISKYHALTIINEFPEAEGKIFAFPFDIPDPYGRNLEIYTATLKEIEKGVDSIICELSDK